MKRWLGDEVLLDKNLIADLVVIRGKVNFGRGTFINGPSRVVAASGSQIKIGPLCSIAAYSCIYSGNHPLENISTYQSSNGFYKDIFSGNAGIVKSIEIGADVWIGTHAVILSGVKIGNGAVIAAGSVVIQDVPPYSVVGGVPAKVIKMRFEMEKGNILNRLEWWRWNDDKIFKNKAFFQVDINKLSLEELESKIKELN